MHGTILHEDALLSRLLKASTWSTRLFKAHDGFDEFTNILWPEQFPESRLRSIRQAFIDDGDAAGYSQEYLNDPFDNSEAYLRKDDFLPMSDEDRWVPKIYHVGVDFAVSKADRANRTSFTIGGRSQDGRICVVDQHVGRWDPVEWIDKMFEIDEKWSPDQFTVEGGVIWKALETTIYQEMRLRDHYLKFEVINPVKDKATRGRPYQKRHRAGGVLYDKKAEWYPAYEAENLRFTGTGDAAADDQFDSTAILVKGFEAAADVDEDDLMDEDELEMRQHDPRAEHGRSAVTGY
jgi:predicted phage terminase large subunit-like protein